MLGLADSELDPENELLALPLSLVDGLALSDAEADSDGLALSLVEGLTLSLAL
jgi:hypothetical protein